MILGYDSLAEQLESIKESLDERGMSALSSFLECKKVNLSYPILIHIDGYVLNIYGISNIALVCSVEDQTILMIVKTSKL